jgi:hypothetical protein
MKCGRCGALLTVGGERLDEVDDRLRLEAYAWATDSPVKCWNCGWQYYPTMKPNDRPKLKMARPKALSEDPYKVYSRLGMPLEMARLMRSKQHARFVDEAFRR